MKRIPAESSKAQRTYRVERNNRVRACIAAVRQHQAWIREYETR
jgi:hypothetical protein